MDYENESLKVNVGTPGHIEHGAPDPTQSPDEEAMLKFLEDHPEFKEEHEAYLRGQKQQLRKRITSGGNKKRTGRSAAKRKRSQARKARKRN